MLRSMSESRPSWTMRLLAGLVLVIAAWIVIKVILGILSAVTGFVVAVVAVVAIVWAYNTLRS